MAAALPTAVVPERPGAPEPPAPHGHGNATRPFPASVMNMRHQPTLRAALDGAEAHGGTVRIDRRTRCLKPASARIEVARPGVAPHVGCAPIGAISY